MIPSLPFQVKTLKLELIVLEKGRERGVNGREGREGKGREGKGGATKFKLKLEKRSFAS
jgi:hypothetical protein